MKALYFLSLFIWLQLPAMAQFSDQQLIGHWKHHDVTNKLGTHVTIDLKPFDLTLSKDHHFVMSGEGMLGKGTWSLHKNVLTLNIAPSADVEGRVQKLYLSSLSADTLVFEVRDFEITGGLMIVLKRKE
jgi:hypothetical protein